MPLNYTVKLPKVGLEPTRKHLLRVLHGFSVLVLNHHIGPLRDYHLSPLRHKKPRLGPLAPPAHRGLLTPLLGCPMSLPLICYTSAPGAGRGTRTHTGVTPPDFESGTSTIPSHRQMWVIIWPSPKGVWWTLWDLNPPDILLAREATTPSSPKAHISRLRFSSLN